MEKVAVIRADFYSNGIIVPLGLTYDDGRTEYINQVLEDRVSLLGDEKAHFITCKSGNQLLTLSFRDCTWQVFKSMDN